MLDAGDQLCLLPLDDVIYFLRVLDDRRLVNISSSSVGLVPVEPGGEIPTCVTKVRLAAFRRDLVNTGQASCTQPISNSQLSATCDVEHIHALSNFSKNSRVQLN